MLTVQDLRRSNFTAADCRKCNFKDANLQGAYFIKSVVPFANFGALWHSLLWAKLATCTSRMESTQDD